MKVSTDACIQGAWTPVDNEVKEILDIGAGTGLLALMLAQRAPGDHIDAIELDVDAAQQAAENVAASPWAASVQVIQGDVTQYLFNKKYELIICNPPFFNNSLLSDSDSKNMARHTGALNYEQLFSAIENNMAAKSVASVMLPVPEHELWEALLNKHGWSVQKKLLVQSKQDTAPVRVISLCGRGSTADPETEILVMRDKNGNHTKAFNLLMAPYYLYL